ncbi:MAG: hypothetical protein ACJ79S_12015 [Gemmatimonadaceae bacterium]
MFAAGVGAFILTGRVEHSPDEMLVLLVKALPKMRYYAERVPRPFIYGISDRLRFDRLDGRD